MSKPGNLSEPEARLSVRLTPRASQNAVQRYEDGVLFLRLTAPPVEGAANEACCRYAAELLGTPKSQVCVASGLKSRSKVLAITGMSLAEVEARLQRYAPPDDTSNS